MKYIYLNLYTEILNFIVLSFVHFDKYIVPHTTLIFRIQNNLLTVKKSLLLSLFEQMLLSPIPCQASVYC